MTDGNTNPDDPRVAVLQAVVDRVTSWQDGADEPTVRKELDDALGESDVDVDDETRERIVRRIVDDGSHFDVAGVLR
ncbi:MAG TPA: hypothetical protein VFG72_00725 [Marmoricola sp.]|nr:hypothetical protein [Marmoricola sp.]